MNRLKELRKDRKLTLQQVSKETGVSVASLSSYENGNRNPKIETWQRLAEFFEVPVEYLQGTKDTFNQEELSRSLGTTDAFYVTVAQVFDDIHKDNIKALEIMSIYQKAEVADYDHICEIIKNILMDSKNKNDKVISKNLNLLYALSLLHKFIYEDLRQALKYNKAERSTRVDNKKMSDITDEYLKVLTNTLDNILGNIQAKDHERREKRIKRLKKSIRTTLH